MLVLSRKKNESIMLGDEIEITIVRVKGDRVRLGFKAPRDLPIHRREVFDLIKAQQAEGGEGVQP